MRSGVALPPGVRLAALVLALTLGSAVACGSEGEEAGVGSSASLPDSLFAMLHARISEEGGYFDTDNLISNESGYLNVLGALERRGATGGAYVGVGPDQNYSYIASIRPELAFIVDVRRDNVLQHLLLKALIEASPTRVEFLSALHGRAPPPRPEGWRDRSAEDIVAWVDGSTVDPTGVAALLAEVEESVTGWGIALSAADLAAIRGFHERFIEEGMDLRFRSHGRPPRSYYPTYRRLVLETDAEGEPASYLTSARRYQVVRDLHRANRILPVVGDLAGPSALPEMGRVMREMGVELTAFYTSNVEFYLWGQGAFTRWSENLAALPAASDAMIIRSYFPRLRGQHPSALPGYYATQMLQPVATLLDARSGRPFDGYGDLVTRDLVPLQSPAGVPR